MLLVSWARDELNRLHCWGFLRFQVFEKYKLVETSDYNRNRRLHRRVVKTLVRRIISC